MQENEKSYGPDALFVIAERSSHPTTVNLFSMEKVKGVASRFMEKETF